jgi:hypothetical protein
VKWVCALTKKARTSVVDGIRWHWLPLLGSRRDLHPSEPNIIAALLVGWVEPRAGGGGLGKSGGIALAGHRGHGELLVLVCSDTVWCAILIVHVSGTWFRLGARIGRVQFQQILHRLIPTLAHRQEPPRHGPSRPSLASCHTYKKKIFWLDSHSQKVAERALSVCTTTTCH